MQIKARTTTTQHLIHIHCNPFSNSFNISLNPKPVKPNSCTNVNSTTSSNFLHTNTPHTATSISNQFKCISTSYLSTSNTHHINSKYQTFPSFVYFTAPFNFKFFLSRSPPFSMINLQTFPSNFQS